MKTAYTIFCVGLLATFLGCNYFGYYPSDSEKIPKAPSVKTIRNNPAAYRSFSSHGFTGK